ncbi:MAG TPA: MarR family transcriptional regulator [Geobacteraceae bacterium]|nr:MarR family transcriptional regulator [Geobacteraceae bacterium]
MEEKSGLIAEIVDNLRRVFQVVHSHSKKAERETGLTGPQLWAIKVIADFAPIRVSDLAERMYLHPATTVGILDRLEKKGLIVRSRSLKDRRGVEVALTAAGRDVVSNAPEVAQGLLVAGLERLSPRRLKSLDSGLALMVDILGAQELPARLFLSREINRPGSGCQSARDSEGENEGTVSGSGVGE